MEYQSFLLFLSTRINPLVVKMQDIYLEDVPRSVREQYQLGKLLEEIGEFTQAMYAGKIGPIWAPGVDNYSDIRGTIPSEAADVILSALSLLIIKKFTVTRCRDYQIDVSDEDLVANELQRAIAYDEASRAISVVFRYCTAHNYDVANHVMARATFNINEVK